MVRDMGSSLQAVCPCGYEARAAIACSRVDHGRVFMFPHACRACGELVNVDLLADSATCPKCSSTQLTRFGVAEPNRKKSVRRNWFHKLFLPKTPREPEAGMQPVAQNSVSSTYCYNLRTTFHLLAEGNQCPKCNQPTLTFEYPDIRVD